MINKLLIMFIILGVGFCGYQTYTLIQLKKYNSNIETLYFIPVDGSYKMFSSWGKDKISFERGIIEVCENNTGIIYHSSEYIQRTLDHNTTN